VIYDHEMWAVEYLIKGQWHLAEWTIRRTRSLAVAQCDYGGFAKLQQAGVARCVQVTCATGAERDAMLGEEEA
jgi:hypothetical protein